jgi:hypothetical protein
MPAPYSGAMELVAMELKAMGAYMARTLSYEVSYSSNIIMPSSLAAN